MTNAPERIWIEDEFGDGDDDQWTYGTWDVRNYMGYDVEYVRADIVQALTEDFERQVQRTDEQREAYEKALSVMEADNERLRDALFAWIDMMNDPSTKLRRKVVEFYSIAIAALK